MTTPLELAGDPTAAPSVQPWFLALEKDPASLAVFPETGEDVSYADAMDAGRRVAAALRDLGVGSGDRVIVVLGNRTEFIGAWLGAMLLNACLVPLNHEMPAEQLERLIGQLAPAAVFSAADGTVDVRAGAREVPYGELTAGAPIGSDEIAAPEPRDITWMLFTGGTTGTPKGILLSQHYVRVFAEYWIASGGLREGDVHLQDLPFHHANGLMGLTMSFALRRRMAVYQRFSVSRYWERVRDTGATTASWLGTMGHLVTKRPEAGPSTLERVKWIPRPPDVRDVEARLRLQLIESYAATECGMTTWTEPASGGVGCGRTRDPYRITIVDERGAEVSEPGQTGEIIVSCDRDLWMCSGYWRDGKLEVQPDGFHEWKSGDLAQRLPDGTFRIVGRATGDIIRHKGENISSREIELAALRHPLVAEAAAVGVQSEIGSEILLVCRAESDRLTPEELSGFLAERLIKQARPRFLAFADELPKTVKQIVPKRELQRFKDGAWDAEAGRS